MQVAAGTVVGGRLVVEGLDIPDGEAAVVLARESAGHPVLDLGSKMGSLPGPRSL